VETVEVRLYENTESDDPVSQWSPEASFDEATSRPRIYRHGRFHLAPRFGEREKFRFPQRIGEVPVYLAAQDEVGTLPHFVKLRNMDVKIGGNEFEMLRRWYRQGKLSKARGMRREHFPATLTPRQMKKLVKRGGLANAHFAAVVLMRGKKDGKTMLLRTDAMFPSLFQLHRLGTASSLIGWATAQMASLFVKYFPREQPGVFAPEELPAEIRKAILHDVRARGIRIVTKISRLKTDEDEE
jgi:saccharopine dehydrogenase-like NADP-dependent oxidoreductase